VSAGTTRLRATRVSLPLRIPALWVPGDVVAVIITAGLALEVGAAVVTKPFFAFVPVAVLGGLLLLVDGRARIAFVVFGGLFFLQSSDSLGTVKLLYLLGVIAAGGGALFRYGQARDWVNRGLAWPLIRLFIVLFALLTVSLFVAHGHDVRRTDWLRDVAPYILFAFVPLFALDAQAAFSRKGLIRILVIAGSVATVSFATYWLEHRHIATLPFSRFGLSSFFLPSSLFAYSIAAALHQQRKRLRWLALAAGAFSLLIITGTRSTLLLLLVPLMIVLGARRNLSSRFVKVLVVTPVALVLISAGTYTVMSATHASASILSKRIAILKHTGTSSDASYIDRQAQAHVAARVFSSNLVFGAGPGTNFDWTVRGVGKRSGFILDSPLDFPAKFGLVGLLALATILLSYGSFVKSAVRINHPRTETLALTGYAALAFANSFLTNILEDKGFSLGLLLLLALVFRTSSTPTKHARPVGRAIRGEGENLSTARVARAGSGS
jgi:hypothetical protein